MITFAPQKSRPALWAVCAAVLALSGAGCRQRMADQPYYRPLEETDFFSDGRASRPIERGTIHRAQYLESDPMVTGLTASEWQRAYEFGTPIAKLDAVTVKEEDRKIRAIGAPRYNQSDNDKYYKKNGSGIVFGDDGKPVIDPAEWDKLKLSPADSDKKRAEIDQTETYARRYPFQITHTDLKRGQERYTIYCAVCHGPLGNGQGKIWERGYLTPTSFHTTEVAPDEVKLKNPVEGLGLSRGYKLWGHRVPMTEVPVGYIFEVMTRGYGGMPSYSAQISPDDRWRIIAYIRVLQLSQHADAAKLPPEIQKLLSEAGGKK